MNDNTSNNGLHSLPAYMFVKTHGQTATLVDMLIELNKTEHFRSAEDALKVLDKYVENFRDGHNDITLRLSLENLNDRLSCCFADGKLDIDLLLKTLNSRFFYAGIEKVYNDYVIAKIIKLIGMLNEFRQYSNPEEIVDDLNIAINDGLNVGGRNVNYLAFGPILGHYDVIWRSLNEHIRTFWNEFAPNGSLDNRLLRDFMIERHQRGIDKYGLKAVIKRNYNEVCHGYVPYRGGASPFYRYDEDTREFKKACDNGRFGPKLPNTLFEYSLFKKILIRDNKYLPVFDYDGHSIMYFVPKKDMTLPVLDCDRWGMKKYYFKSVDEKKRFISEKTVILSKEILALENGYLAYPHKEGKDMIFYFVSEKDGLPLFDCNGSEIHVDESEKTGFISFLKHERPILTQSL